MTIIFFRTKQSRRGENIESCETLDEAAKYNKPVCAERLWKTMNHKQDAINDALFTAAEHDSCVSYHGFLSTFYITRFFSFYNSYYLSAILGYVKMA